MCSNLQIVIHLFKKIVIHLKFMVILIKSNFMFEEVMLMIDESQHMVYALIIYKT